MKKILFPICLTMIMWINGFVAVSQAIIPDTVFQSKYVDENNHQIGWMPDGAVISSYNGDLYMIGWAEEYTLASGYACNLYVYKFLDGDFQPLMINNSNKIVFGFPCEGDDSYMNTPDQEFKIYGNAFAFDFNGRLWFYSLIRRPYCHGYNYDSKNCLELWAYYSLDSSKWTTWYNELSEPPNRYKLGACQVDSTIRMFSADKYVPQIYVDQYGYDEATDRLVFQEDLPFILNGDKFGGVIISKDTLGNNRFLFSTCHEGIATYLTYFSPKLGMPILLATDIGSGISTIVQGTIQAQRPDAMFNTAIPNMFSVFKVTNYALSDLCHGMWNEEWSIPDDPMAKPKLQRLSSVTLPTYLGPVLIDKHYQLIGTSRMNSAEFTTEIAGPDGMQQETMIFYPNYNICGAFFNSDIWRPIPGTLVSSTDLANDALYGPQIRDMWTLVGITDGAPPCSINWPVWTSLHTPEVEPTELTFTTENVSSTEVTSTYEDSYTFGQKVKTGFSKEFSVEAGYKYTNAYKTKVSSKNQFKTRISNTFGLNEESQELGYYLWLIPSVRRISYQVYPCWDKNLEHPITNSFQYQFHNSGVSLQKKNIEISDFPFEINEPNAISLEDWTIDHRTALYSSALNYDLQPLTFSWTAPTPGDLLALSETTTQTSSVETSSAYNLSMGVSVKVPEVFKVNEEIDQEITYSTENVFETEFGTELEVSLKNLITKSDGINISTYNVSVYWFKPNDGDWWYFDSLAGQKPWYIAYTVGETMPELELLSPSPGTRIISQEMSFSWKCTEGELHDYKFFIADAPLISPASTLYKQVCGDKSTANPEDFTPEPGKTYYWAVRGMTDKGEAVWSESRAFSLGSPDGSSLAEAGMNVCIYPNPVRNTGISINFELQRPGKVSFTLYNSDGRLIRKQEETFNAGGNYNRMMSPVNATPGIFFLVITSNDSSVTKKLVILK